MRNIISRFCTLFSSLKSNFYLVRFITKQKGGKKYVVLRTIISVLDAGFSVIIAILPGLLMNELIYNKTVEKTVILLGALVILPVIRQIIIITANLSFNKISNDIQTQTNVDFFIHLSQIDIEFREIPGNKTNEDIARETLCNATESVDLLFGLVSGVIQLISIATVVSILHPLIAVSIIANVIVCSLITKKANEKKNRLTQEYYKMGRYTNRFENYLIQFNYVCDIALFNLTDFFINKYIKAKSEADSLEVKRNGYIVQSNTKVAILNGVQEAILYTYMVICVLVNDMQVGYISVFTNAAHQFSNALNTIFHSFNSMSEKKENIDITVEYMNTPLLKMTSGNRIPKFEENSVIEFKDVSFHYPGNSHLVLNHFNMVVRYGERVCIVGENGVGKTTFIKLLLRIYRPSSGSILLDGVDINEYDYKMYWDLFSPVFQDCTLFGGLSFVENIVLNHPYAKDTFMRICGRNSLNRMIEGMPKGIETIIDNWVDEEGIRPSGGETQRMVISRAMYHKKDIIMLDEPTAALDPKAEYEIYSQFNEIISNKTAVLITHRLSAVQLADKVAVFDDGHVVEYGTHSELYAKGGIYKEMFDKQSEFYVKAANEAGAVSALG